MLICCIVYELSLRTKYRLPLVMGLFHWSKREENAFLWHRGYWVTCYDIQCWSCTSTVWCTDGNPIHSWVTIVIVLKWQDVWVIKCSEVLLFSRKHCSSDHTQDWSRVQLCNHLLFWKRVVCWPHFKLLHMTAGVTGQLSCQASMTSSNI